MGERTAKFSKLIQESFEQALKRGYGWRLYPECGYKASPDTNFCVYYGIKLLSRD